MLDQNQFVENQHARHILARVHETKGDHDNFILGEHLRKLGEPRVEVLDHKCLGSDHSWGRVLHEGLQRAEYRVNVTVKSRLNLGNPDPLLLGLLLLPGIDYKLEDMPSYLESRTQIPRLLEIRIGTKKTQITADETWRDEGEIELVVSILVD